MNPRSEVPRRAAALVLPAPHRCAGHPTTTAHDGDSSTILSAAAGIEHIIHAAEQRGLDTGVLAAARTIAQRAIETGHGNDSFSRLTETLTAPARASAKRDV